jgi:ribosomal protein S18 acetylase RimI-like enzyme
MTWPVRKLTEPGRIAAFLERDPLYAAYAIADLDPTMLSHTRWYVAEVEGEARSLTLFFDRLEPGALFVMGDPTGLPVILGSALRPRHVYASARHRHLPALRAYYRLGRPQTVVRMALDTQIFRFTGGEVIRLSPAYTRQLERLYSMGQGGAFSPYQVAQGVFYGVTHKDRLVATAGTHVVSESYGVAAVGNVFTHPAYRRRGLGTRCTGAVVQELLERGIQTVVLNVQQDNETAYRIYRRMGFKEHCRYVEVAAERRTR